MRSQERDKASEQVRLLVVVKEIQVVDYYLNIFHHQEKKWVMMLLLEELDKV
jgi:hypothetical protein